MQTTLGDRIRKARKAAGLTQRQLAESIKVSNTSISNWENGFSNPDPDTIQHLCWALNVQPNYFFSVEDLSPTPEAPKENKIKIAARDGSYEERILSDDQMAAVKAFLQLLPDAPEDL